MLASVAASVDVCVPLAGLAAGDVHIRWLLPAGPTGRCHSLRRGKGSRSLLGAVAESRVQTAIDQGLSRSP